MIRKTLLIALSGLLMLTMACKNLIQKNSNATTDSLMVKLNDFSVFRLTTDTSVLTEKEKQMIPLLIEAARLMDDIFWMEAWGDKNALLDSLKIGGREKTCHDQLRTLGKTQQQPIRFCRVTVRNHAGANFYPADMTEDEFNNLSAPGKTSLYTLLRRDETGSLVVIPYHEAFREPVTKASELIKQASVRLPRIRA